MRIKLSDVTKPVRGTLQEGGASFQTTHWTVVLQASEKHSDVSAQALSNFCEAYWPPLYTFLRHRGHSPADAQDLVQGFFAFILEHETLGRADRERGRLRTFLLAALQNFVRDEHVRGQALKRGGSHEILSLDQNKPDVEAATLRTAHLDDISCYDLTWASTIAKRSWQQLHQLLVAEGKSQWLDELKPFVAGVGPRANQEEVATRLGVPVATLRTWLSRLRQRYRELLRAEVANTVSNPADVDEELRYLHRILMS